jgi:DNA-binding transcriptional regulator YhcF (GntR family)
MTQGMAITVTKAEAREWMDSIVDDLETAMSRLEKASASVKRFDTSGAYKLLGYRSMAGCLAVELKVTRQRAYQIMEQVEQGQLLSEATGETVVVTAREARALKRNPAAREHVAELVEHGEAVHEAVRHVTEPPVVRVRFDDGYGGIPDDVTGDGDVAFRCPKCGWTAPVVDDFGI